MDRIEILAAMSTLKLHGTKTAYEEIITTGVKRQHEPPVHRHSRFTFGDLLNAEITESEGRAHHRSSSRYQC